MEKILLSLSLLFFSSQAIASDCSNKCKAATEKCLASKESRDQCAQKSWSCFSSCPMEVPDSYLKRYEGPTITQAPNYCEAPTTITTRDARCGFNDLGIGKAAEYYCTKTKENKCKEVCSFLRCLDDSTLDPPTI